MTEAKKVSRPEKNSSHSTTFDEEKIRVRAYELYEERGKEDGRDLDDWLKAEEEIRRAARVVAA